MDARCAQEPIRVEVCLVIAGPVFRQYLPTLRQPFSGPLGAKLRFVTFDLRKLGRRPMYALVSMQLELRKTNDVDSIAAWLLKLSLPIADELYIESGNVPLTIKGIRDTLGHIMRRV